LRSCTSPFGRRRRLPAPNGRVFGSMPQVPPSARPTAPPCPAHCGRWHWRWHRHRTPTERCVRSVRATCRGLFGRRLLDW
jgi:hypothetical protein